MTLARRAVALAENKQAHDIVLLDISSLSTIADYFIICSGDSERQLRTIAEYIDDMVHREFERNPRIEGEASTGWIVLDYGDLVIHVFSPDQRDYYRLEQLWGKASPVVVVQ